MGDVIHKFIAVGAVVLMTVVLIAAIYSVYIFPGIYVHR